MRFTLEIELGNEEMQDGDHVYDAITRSLLHRTDDSDAWMPNGRLATDDSGTIRDSNGNKVGKWEVTA